ncbi:helix-turn-helix domain-containing protein [Xenorhabdus bharatensis]|uniref:helix-turn-helix domain-containing protein n=1 Tax=Xenorhabdus bharatensis TaxID=3136256 RepID=UPI0030F38D06
MSTTGSRIAEERARLGLSQDEFASLVGYSLIQQICYERDEIPIGGLYLQALTKHGVDTLYIITGNRLHPINISTEEQEIIENYRAMNEAHRLKISTVSDTFTYSIINRSVVNSHGSN